MNDVTMKRGLEQLAAIEGSDRPSIVEALRYIAPDLASMAIGFAYGQIYTRGALDLRQRQLVTVAALASMGGLEPQLKFHLAGALNVGCSPTELVELMTHLVVYAGFPVALNGTAALKEVLEQRGVVVEVGVPGPASESSRFDEGLACLRKIDGAIGEHVIASLKDIAPDLARFIVEFAFGDVYTRPGLDLISRELVTVAALAAIGSATPQLKVHMHGLLNVGGTRGQLVETVIHLCAYAGFPRAINAAMAAKDVLADRERG
jgi:4-carboxymuconolactone decarboxylase